MQQTSVVQKRLYHINNIDERDYSPIVWERKDKLDKMALLLNEGVSVRSNTSMLCVLQLNMLFIRFIRDQIAEMLQTS